jgi:hypothetical protein
MASGVSGSTDAVAQSGSQRSILDGTVAPVTDPERNHATLIPIKGCGDISEWV